MGRGNTTMIQRVLERRAERPLSGEEGTSATVRVMVRVLPPPKALLIFEDEMLSNHTQRRIESDLLDLAVMKDEFEALRILKAEVRPIVLTDNPEFIRKVRGAQGARAPFVLFVSGLDDPQEREAALRAGADDCIERRAFDEEFNARLRGARRIAELEAVLRTTLSENRKLSTIDDLTQLASRRFFRKQFPREVERAARRGQALSLLLCDIDHFKKINDACGHAGGDDILRQFGPRLQRVLRSGIDWVARIGGEEFAVVLPDTGHDAALALARRMRGSLAQGAFKAGRKSIAVTASFGLCAMEHMPPGETRPAERMVRMADAALYRSKNDGRNRVTAAVQRTAKG